MAWLLIIFSLLAYALAALLLWRERTWRAPLVLVAGAVTVLILPFWLQLFRVVPPQSSLADTYNVSTTIAAVFGGPLVVLPVLLFSAGLSQQWWSRHYGLVWLAYVGFVLYFLVIGRILMDTRLVPQLTLLGSREDAVLAVLALLMAGVSLGIVFTLVSTRDYAAVLAVLAVALSGVFATALFWGLLGSPLWAVRLLGISTLSRSVAIGLVILCSLLVLWGVHLLASVLHAGRRRQFTWN